MSCPDCFKGSVLLGDPTGTVLDNGVYLAPSSKPTTARAIVLLTDIFGLALKNPKIVADNLAARLECDVYVPDMFNGQAPVRPDQMTMPEVPGVVMSFMDYVRLIFKILPSLPALIRHRPSVVDARITPFLAQLKEDKKYDKIGVVGYCFGGTIAVRVGSTDLVDSLVIAHPGSLTIPQIKAIKAPTAWQCAEEDMVFKPALRAQAEAVFAERQGNPDFLDYEFVDYKGTTHGFAARPNLALPAVKDAFEKAFEQMAVWFNKTIPA